MEKTFTTHSSAEVPDMTDKVLQVSDWFFALVKTLGGENKRCMAAYDFKKEKWIFGTAGFTELVEYYKN